MSENKWAAIPELVKELKRCQDAGHLPSALVMSFVVIDTMSFLALPEGRSEQTRKDFIKWVDTYLKAHVDQAYQYRGIDVYAARCGLLHAFSAESERHRKDPTIRPFLYTDGGKHLVGVGSTREVLIGGASFVNDVMLAVETFLRECESDAALRARVEPRLGQVFRLAERRRYRVK